MPVEISKVVVTSFGGPENVEIVKSTLPDPSPKQVQVKVLYSGFSGADINMRRGTYPLQRKAPLTPGYCFVGTVHANGPQSTRFKVDDLVACLSIYDAEATYINQPEKYLIPVPAGIDLKVATAFILDWNTAYGMVKGRISKGQKVFVHGMSGAVGYALMVLCKAQGAEVYGTASEQKHNAIRALGATPFVYTNKDWIQAMRTIGGVQAVFDPLGFESWDESYSIVSPWGGILFGYGGNLLTLNGAKPRSVVWPTLKLLAQNLKFWSRKSTVFYYISRDQASFEPHLKELFTMALQDKIEVPIKKIFELDNIRMAHEEWSKLGGMGSIVIKVA